MTEARKNRVEQLMIHEMRSSVVHGYRKRYRGLNALEPNTARHCFRFHRKSRAPVGQRSFCWLEHGFPNTRNLGPSKKLSDS